jgi:hypothetical protein
VVVVRYRNMEISDTGVDADGCLSVNAIGHEQPAHDKQQADRMAHRYLSAYYGSK